jgi:hypothetical protein
METQALTFTNSPFWPVAIGFFGLGVGYFIWGGQALFGFPKPSPEVDRTMGMWGFWMPGFLQFLTGVYLMIGLTWFDVFGNAAPLYMAGLAFTAYGIHWFAMTHRRYIDSSTQLDGNRLSIPERPRNWCLPEGRRHTGHDRIHWPLTDLRDKRFPRIYLAGMSAIDWWDYCSVSPGSG